MKKKYKYSLNLLTDQDEEILLIWRNHKSVRKWSFNKNKISKEIHKQWFVKNLNEKKNIIRIFKYNQAKCGMVRLNLMKKNYNLNYLIAQNYRKKKLGKIMLMMFLKQLKESSVFFDQPKIRKIRNARKTKVSRTSLICTQKS